MQKVTHHISHYLPLMGILVATFVGFMVFSYDKAFQFAVVLAASVSYVSWGMIHHYIHKDLYIGVFAEYLAYAVIGVIITYSILFF